MPNKVAAILLFTSALLLVPCSVQANSVSSFPISGSANSTGCCEGIVFSGGSLSANLQDPSGPLTQGSWAPGTVVPFQLTIGWCSVLQGCSPGLTSIMFGGKTTDMIGGSFLFSGTFTAPTGQPGSDVSITIPVIMIGNVVGFQDLAGNPGPQMFNLKFQGTGVMTIDFFISCNATSCQDIATDATVKFSGTATTVPEPSSLGLLVTGLVGLIGAMRRRFFSRP